MKTAVFQDHTQVKREYSGMKMRKGKTTNSNFFDEVFAAIATSDPEKKCRKCQHLCEGLSADLLEFSNDSPPVSILSPGLPAALKVVSPRNLKKRSVQSPEGRAVLFHAIAHIEFNAINLALDAAYRFRNQPVEFYLDWLRVAADEARHFRMIENYLNDQGYGYGDFPAHNGLWDMALRTEHDVVARLALVPRVMEARGLDVTPGMIKRLKGTGDCRAIEILETIYTEEIEHVKIGSRWFRYHCDLRNLDPATTFMKLVNTYFHGEMKGPFNKSARLQAGFDIEELALLDAL